MTDHINRKLEDFNARLRASLNDRELGIIEKRMLQAPVHAGSDPLLEPGDKVLHVFDGAFRTGEVEAAGGSFVAVSGGAVLNRRTATLLPPDADSDLAAIVNTLGNAIVLALRRRIPSVPFGCPVGAWLHRVYVPTFENAPGAIGSVTGSHHFLAVHECAFVACAGDTPREALHWLASELWWQLEALRVGDSYATMILSWAECEMGRALAPAMPRTAFVNECSGDAIALWVDAFETMAMMARAAAPATP